MLKVDLNSDLGEGFGSYKIGEDKEIIKNISSANIACGWHAGDSLIMEKTVKLAKIEGVAVGAHPGYFDMAGFGRRNLHVSAEELKSYVKYQLGALMAFAKSNGVSVEHVKPHGAMYNMAAKNYDLAEAVAQAIYEVDDSIILLGLANSQLIKAGKEIGLKVANEVFADRAYMPDGTLVPRNDNGAVIHDTETAIKRVVRMVKEGRVEAIDSTDIDIKADSICVHGDNPKSLDFVKNIRKALEKENIEITSLRKVLK